MSPEYLTSNMWSLLKGETIEGKDGRVVKGPLAPIKVEGVFKQLNLMLVQTPDGSKIEIEGTDFEKAVNKNQYK